VKQYGAFAFRKADKGLMREFNSILKQFIGTPEHLALVRRFGITAADLPAQGVTAKALCQFGNPGPPQQLAAPTDAITTLCQASATATRIVRAEGGRARADE
jgi:hypothetical protein